MSNPEYLFKTFSKDDPSWVDISKSETERTYVLTNGSRYKIKNPVALHVKRKPEGDAHRIIDKEGVSHYIAAGCWLVFFFKGEWAYESEKE